MPDTGRYQVGKHLGTRFTYVLPCKNLHSVINSIISYSVTVKSAMKEKYRELK